MNTRTILITGVNTGIGFALASRLLNQGHTVIGHCRKTEYFGLLRLEFKAYPEERWSLYAFDLESDFTEELEKIEAAHGVPDVIINNAGIFLNESGVMDEDWANIEKTMRVNVRAPMRLCSYFAPKMKTKSWGRILNISSKMGSLEDNTSGGCLSYRMSKVALNMYIVNLAHEMADSAIKVLCMHPGWIQTRMGGQNAPDDVEKAVDRILFGLSEEGAGFHGQFVVGSTPIPW